MFWYFDKPLVYTIFILIIVGTATVYSATNYDLQLLIKHLAGVFLSLFLFISIIVGIPTTSLQKFSKYAFIIAALICIATLSPLGQEINGAKVLIKIGNIFIHTGELINLFSILYLASYIDRYRETILSTSFGVYRPLIPLSFLCIFMLVPQSDISGSFILFISIMGTLFLSGAPLLSFIAIFIFSLLAITIIIVFEPYRMERLATFTNPWSDPYGSGFQLAQSLIAFGRGELFGLGYGASIQKLSYLPEAHREFIFAVFTEEFGAVGAICLMLLLLYVAYRILHIGRLATISGNWFGGSLAYFTAILFACSVLFNIGVNIGILPTSGLSLPFISYDRQNLMITLLLMGFIVRIDLERKAGTLLREQT